MIVFVFAVGFLIILQMYPDLGTAYRVVFGFLLAAPLATAFLWDRLRTVKVLGVEIALSEATVDVPTLGEGAREDALADQQWFSGAEEILQQISKSVRDPNRQVLEINLRSKPYWWLTRLFLEAALLDDHSNVRCLVFVDGDASRRYVGTTGPRDLREALAKSMPCLETIYQKLDDEKLSIEDLLQRWAIEDFDGQSEQNAKSLVSSNELRALLGKRLKVTAVHRGEREGPLLYHQIISRSEQFVPVLSNDRLERVVDANTLARRWSLATLENVLS